MTEGQRVERARQAKLALDNFLDPAFAVVAEEYQARLTGLCATRPWATNEIAALANATRVVTEVRSQIAALVADGAEAQNGIDRAKRIEGLSPARKRLLNIGI